MKISVCLLSVFFILLQTKCQNNVPLYVGTYTTGDSEGIYHYQFNTETGVLSQKQLALITENPSFITYSPNRNFIYAVNETETGTISALKVENNNRLTFINSVITHGAHPCHVAMNAIGDNTVVSNYTGGNFSLHRFKEDGSINKAFQVINHKTDSIASHVHSAQFFNDELFVADLGRNAVFQYQLKDDGYKISSSSIVNMEDNLGPRHFSISKSGKFIYIINEYGSSITSVKRTANGFKDIDYDSTLDETYRGNNACADIHLSKDERFLYGSNRGENTIVVFKRDLKTGTLEKIQNIEVHGDWPRNFTLDPSGKFLLVANERSNNISIFKINQVRGTLQFLNAVNVPSPVCLLF